MCNCERQSNPLSRRDFLQRSAALGAVAASSGLWLPSQALAAVPVPTIHSTSAWGARAASSAVSVLSYKPSFLVIHHTATSNTTATTQAAAFSLARSIQNYHMDNNGWIDTGQQFTVTRGGYALEGRHRTLERLATGTSFVRGSHVGAGNVNTVSVGIENEGTYTTATPPAALFTQLTNLCAHLCNKYGIAATQIFGHRDFMATACPGDVLYSMLPSLRSAVASILAGYEAIVDNTTAGRFTASANWATSSWSTQKYGADYRYASPVAASDTAWYKFNIPSTGNYLVDAWHPANASYNAIAPYVVVTSSGNQVVNVNQQTGGGQWKNLGTFNLTAGDNNVVGISRWTTGTSYVLADAVRIRSA